jgi:ribulose-phosphate 3-epimerase
MKIAPSLLAADFGDLKSEIDSVKNHADMLHIDVMDGAFVPPITFGENMVALCKKYTALPLDVHLMVERPEDKFDSFIEAGASLLTFHIEASAHAYRSLSYIRSKNVKSGIALNPGTHVAEITPVLEVADLVLVMTVNPGWGGQKFIDSMLKKIELLREEINKKSLPTVISVDGGIDQITGSACLNAGASVLVAGNYIFSSKNRSEKINSLRAL